MRRAFIVWVALMLPRRGKLLRFSQLDVEHQHRAISLDTPLLLQCAQLLLQLKSSLLQRVVGATTITPELVAGLLQPRNCCIFLCQNGWYLAQIRFILAHLLLCCNHLRPALILDHFRLVSVPLSRELRIQSITLRNQLIYFCEEGQIPLSLALRKQPIAGLNHLISQGNQPLFFFPQPLIFFLSFNHPADNHDKVIAIVHAVASNRIIGALCGFVIDPNRP